MFILIWVTKCEFLIELFQVHAFVAGAMNELMYMNTDDESNF